MTVRAGAGGTALSSTFSASAIQSINVTARLGGGSSFPAFVPQDQLADVTIIGGSFIFCIAEIIPIPTATLSVTASLISTAQIRTEALVTLAGTSSLLALAINFNQEHFIVGDSTLIAEAELSRPPGPVVTDEDLYMDTVLIKRDDKPRYHYS